MQIIAAALALSVVAGIALVALFLVGSVLVTAFFAIDSKWIPVTYNVRSLTRRRVTTTVTVLGMSLAVGVFSAGLQLRNGIRKTLVTAGRDDNTVILRKGSNSEVTSVVDREQAKLIASREEVALDPKDGKPLVDPQVAVLIYAQREGGGENDGANVFVRGLSERTTTLHPTVKLAKGRWFQPGTSEVVIGRSLAGKFIGAKLDGELSFARRTWKVVGVIDAGGSGFDSEIWGDVDQVMAAFQRTLYSTMIVRVKDKRSIPAMAEAVSLDPRLSLDVKQEEKYYEDLSSGLSNLLGFLGIFVSVVFSLGATLGATISMYAQVAARIREVGVLRALGYRRSAVFVSFVIESVLLGLIAGGVGVGLSALMQFASFSTLNFGTFSEVTFRFALTPDVMWKSAIFAGVMGYAGGVLPAARAFRTPITQAVKG